MWVGALKLSRASTGRRDGREEPIHSRACRSAGAVCCQHLEHIQPHVIRTTRRPSVLVVFGVVVLSRVSVFLSDGVEEGPSRGPVFPDVVAVSRLTCRKG